jgi:hypothetical protein
VASLKSRTKASVLIQKYIAIGMKNKEKEDYEEQHADIAYMVKTEDDSEVDLTSDAESDTDQENEKLGTKEQSYFSLQIFFSGSATSGRI